MSTKKYVNPNDVVNSEAKDLTDEQTQEVLHDSYRSDYVFIKDHIYPVYRTKEDGDVEVVEDPRVKRPWFILSELFLKQPLAISGDEKKVLYGYRNIVPVICRDEDEAVSIATKIFKSHNSYCHLRAVPGGIPQPITTWEVTNEEKGLDVKYHDEIVLHQEEEDNFVLQQRKAEQKAKQVQQEEEVEGDLNDFIKQQLRLHSAEKRMKEAKQTLADCERVMIESQKKIDTMLQDHPEYDDQALPTYQDMMEELGFLRPESFYDQFQYERQGDASNFLQTSVKK